jgi:hypothetical protein
MGMFFNENREQKKWFIIVNALLPLAAAIWGIIISQLSYSLSKQTAKNTDQIDKLTAMVGQLQRQNDLLQHSVAIQDSQFSAYKSELIYTRRPMLRISNSSGIIKEEQNISFQGELENNGGDVFDLKFVPLFGAKIDDQTLPKDHQWSSGSTISVYLYKLDKLGAGARLYFRDGLNIHYYQDLKRKAISTKNEEMILGPLQIIKKHA